MATGSLGDRIIKVDHAGEHGAVNIYAGQLLVAKMFYPALVETLAEFQRHERRHLATFGAELARRNHPRCRSFHFCGVGGFILGLISGLLGSSAIGATTAAVERVVLRHLADQVEQLRGIDEPAVAAITSIREGEQSHLDNSLGYIAPGSFSSKVFDPVVRWSTEAVIWLGMRL